MPMLSPWPLYNQLADWTVDADGVDENRENNCGPESVAMCLKYLTGVELPADFIKDAIYGASFTGYTFMGDLARFLKKRCDLTCEIRSGQEPTLQPIVKRAIDAGFPTIVLFFFELEKPDSGHFAPVVGYDEGGATRANPWGGKLEYMKWPDFETWQKSSNIIILNRQRPDNLGRGGLEADPLIQGVEDLLDEAQPYVDRALREAAETSERARRQP